MNAHVNNVTVDCTDPDVLAGFYAALLGREIVWQGGPYVVVGRGVPQEPNLVFQRVEDLTPGKSRIHLDVHATDVEETTARAESLGATRGEDVAELGMSWRVMRDPEGNPFCIAPSR